MTCKSDWMVSNPAKSDRLLLYTLWNGTIEENGDEIESLIVHGEYAKAVEVGLKSLGSLAGRGETWFADGIMESIFDAFADIISDEMCDNV